MPRGERSGDHRRERSRAEETRDHQCGACREIFRLEFHKERRQRDHQEHAADQTKRGIQNDRFQVDAGKRHRNRERDIGGQQRQEHFAHVVAADKRCAGQNSEDERRLIVQRILHHGSGRHVKIRRHRPRKCRIRRGVDQLWKERQNNQRNARRIQAFERNGHTALYPLRRATLGRPVEASAGRRGAN